MKKLLLFLSFLLFNSFLSFAAAQPNPVRDLIGEEITTGFEYDIMTILSVDPNLGGVIIPERGNGSCPAGVIQWHFYEPYPVIFRPANPEEGVVRVSTDLNIRFTQVPTPNVCNDSNVWTIGFDEKHRQHFVVTNGVEGNPGCETLPNWFKIEPVWNIFYRLVFCPTVYNSTVSNLICRDVGIFVDQDGTRRLALGGELFLMFFVRFGTMQEIDMKTFLNQLPLPKFHFQK